MKILTKYILREHFWPLMFALSALAAGLVIQQIPESSVGIG